MRPQEQNDEPDDRESQGNRITQDPADRFRGAARGCQQRIRPENAGQFERRRHAGTQNGQTNRFSRAMKLIGSYLISAVSDRAPVEGDDLVPDFDSRSLGRAIRPHHRYNKGTVLSLERIVEAELNGREFAGLARGHQEIGIECRGRRENNRQHQQRVIDPPRPVAIGRRGRSGLHDPYISTPFAHTSDVETRRHCGTRRRGVGQRERQGC